MRSSLSHMRDAIVHGILVIFTPFLRPAGPCVHFERPVHVWANETMDTNRDRTTEFPRQLWSSTSNMRDAIVHGILVISTPYIPPVNPCVMSKQCMYGSRTTIETMDTNRDRATEFPRQLWSSFSNKRDAIVESILVISTPFLRPASPCVHFERPVHVWETHHPQNNRQTSRQSDRIPKTAVVVF